MPIRRNIITTVRDANGTTLALYREAGLYIVGTLGTDQRLCPLGGARYATYVEAHDRLDTERRQRAIPLPR